MLTGQKFTKVHATN